MGKSPCLIGKSTINGNFQQGIPIVHPTSSTPRQPRGTTKRSAGRTSTFAEQPAPAGEKQFDPLLDPWQLGTASVARNINGYKWL